MFNHECLQSRLVERLPAGFELTYSPAFSHWTIQRYPECPLLVKVYEDETFEVWSSAGRVSVTHLPVIKTMVEFTETIRNELSLVERPLNVYRKEET